MRILFIVPSINLETGGPSKASLALARDLAKHGQQVEMFSTCWPQPQSESVRNLELDGVPARLFPKTSIPGMGHVPYSRELVNSVRRDLHRFDVCLSASLWNPLISHATAIVRQRGVPYAITPHGMMDPIVFARNRAMKSCWARSWERRNVEGAGLIVFNSVREESKAKSSGWRMRQTLVLPHSIELTAGKRLPPRDHLEEKYPSLAGKKVVAFVGRINWVKNLALLIAAVARMRNHGQNIALLCAGPDSDGHRRELEQTANTLGLGDNLIFTGMLGGEPLQAVYARADAIALVSKKENFGLSAAEALAAGIPVVLSDGVDIGEDLPTPPVWRVAQDEQSIAEGLSAALLFSDTAGLPAREAYELAELEWGTPQTEKLITCLESIVKAHNAAHLPGNPQQASELNAARPSSKLDVRKI